MLLLPLQLLIIDVQDLLHFIVVGGGPTGVEVAAELQARTMLLMLLLVFLLVLLLVLPLWLLLLLLALTSLLQDLISDNLAGADSHALYKNALRGGPKVTLVQSGDRLLNAYHKGVSEIAVKEMMSAGVDVRLNARVKKVGPNSVTILNKKTKQLEVIPSALTHMNS